jgi:hypothetical protein
MQLEAMAELLSPSPDAEGEALRLPPLAARAMAPQTVTEFTPH